MLKTPKTMIAATAAAVVIIGGITAAIIATNHENTPSSGGQTRQEGQQASSGSGTDRESQQTSYDTDEIAFWLHTADWGEEKDLTGITLFNGECTAPIRLEDFDGDEHLAPYSGGVGYDHDFCAYSYNLTELLDSDQSIDDHNLSFHLQSIYNVDTRGYSGTCSAEDESTIRMIYVCDYSGEKISLRQAYENNWFYITAQDNFIDEFNFDDRITFTNFDVMVDIFDAMISKYGRPSYVIARDPSYLDESKDSFPETFEKNDGRIDYYLVWEKEDFVLILSLWETIESAEESHRMSLGDVNNHSFVYMSAELWPQYKESRYKNGYIIYDLDDLK